MSEPRLAVLLERVGRRRRSLGLWRRLAFCWAAAGLMGLGLLALRRPGSAWFSLAPALTGAAGLLAALVVALRHLRSRIDWREVVVDIERGHPDLDGRLLTAMQQQGRPREPLNYLQQRLRREALEHGRQHNWSEAIPSARLSRARWAHWFALMFFALALWQLRTPAGTVFSA